MTVMAGKTLIMTIQVNLCVFLQELGTKFCQYMTIMYIPSNAISWLPTLIPYTLYHGFLGPPTFFHCLAVISLLLNCIMYLSSALGISFHLRF